LIKAANRQKATLWALGVFTLLLLISSLLSELFRAPGQKHDPLGQYRTLLAPETIQNLKYLKIQNQIGSIELQRDEVESEWLIISPKKLPAMTSVVNQILNILKEIKIRSIHELDPINLSNYSLKNPSLSVSFGENQEFAQKIHLGLVNPIDETLYISLSSKQAIFQVDSFVRKVEKLDFSDFINTHVFRFDKKNITKMAIYNGSVSPENIKIFLEKTNGRWVDQKGKELNQLKVHDYISNFTILKSSLILDEQIEGHKNKITEFLNAPHSTVQITTSNTKQIQEYIISKPLPLIPGVKMEKYQNIFIYSKETQYPFVINKKHLSLFRKKMNSLKKISIKKLYY